MVAVAGRGQGAGGGTLRSPGVSRGRPLPQRGGGGMAWRPTTHLVLLRRSLYGVAPPAARREGRGRGQEPAFAPQVRQRPGPLQTSALLKMVVSISKKCHGLHTSAHIGFHRVFSVPQAPKPPKGPWPIPLASDHVNNDNDVIVEQKCR